MQRRKQYGESFGNSMRCTASAPPFGYGRRLWARLPRASSFPALAYLAILAPSFAGGIDQRKDSLNKSVGGEAESAEGNSSQKGFDRYGVLVSEHKDCRRYSDGGAKQRDEKGHANRRPSHNDCSSARRSSARRGIGIHGSVSLDQ